MTQDEKLLALWRAAWAYEQGKGSGDLDEIVQSLGPPPAEDTNCSMSFSFEGFGCERLNALYRAVAIELGLSADWQPSGPSDPDHIRVSKLARERYALPKEPK